jgi:indole-3-glycerol phosphate synthase
MNILETIVGHKRKEVAQRKKEMPVAALERNELYGRPCLSLRESIMDPGKTGFIAEFKRQSPSRGVINDRVSAAVVTKGYADAGASGLSVLTDRHFFGGGNEDLLAARTNEIPILRKDFVIDEYQVVEAKAIGADVILLIAACLSPAEVKRLAEFAGSLGLEVLLEIHGEEELEHICDATMLVGVNNRDLKTFTVDVDRSIRLSRKIPGDRLLVAESGIHDADTVRRMRDAGFHGFLVGEHFMKEADPAIAFASFVKQLKG